MVLQKRKSAAACLHINTEIKTKIVESVKELSYIVSVVLDLVVDGIMLFPEYSGSFPYCSNNGSRISKLKIA